MSGSMSIWRPMAALLVILLALVAKAGADDQAPAREMLAKGIREVSHYNFDAGRKWLEKALAVHPAHQRGDVLWQRIVFALATAHHYASPSSRDHVAQAQRLYEELVEQSPGSPLAVRAMLNLGRIAEVRDHLADAIDLPAAAMWYEKAMQAGRGGDIEHEAAMRLGCVYLQQQDKPEVVREGIALLTAHLGKHPDNFYAGPMWQLIGEAHAMVLHEPDAAAQAFVNADQRGIVSGQAGLYYWRIANIDHQAGRIERAARYYKKIITHAPHSGRAYEAQLKLKELRQSHPDLVGDIPPLQLVLHGEGHPSPKADGGKEKP